MDVEEIDRFRMLLRLQVLAAFGCFLILCYAWHFHYVGDSLRIIGIGLLAAGASLLSGFLMGFIFGVPRVTKETETATSTTSNHSTGEHPGPITTNSNLIEISDWLTKIIVGVGLVELKSIPSGLSKLASYLGPGLRPPNCDPTKTCSDYLGSGEAAGIAIIIFFCTIGFLIGYVWTLLYFQGDLSRQLRGLEQKVNELAQGKREADLSASAEIYIMDGLLDKAMEVVDEALKENPADGRIVLTKARILKREALKAEPPDREKLNQALSLADEAMKLLPGKGEPIYNKACYQLLLGAERDEVLGNLKAAFALDPSLRAVAAVDDDLQELRQDDDFKKLLG